MGEFSIDVEAKPGEARLESGSRTLDLTYGVAALSGTWPGRLTFDANRISAGLDDERRIELADLTLRVDGNFSDIVVAIDAGGVQPSLPGLTPPSFDAVGKIIRRGRSLDGELEMIATGGQPRLRARARHNFEFGNGVAEILDAHLRFAPGVLQPGDLISNLTQEIENVFATISVEGTVAWEGGGKLVPKLEIKIEDLAATTENFELFNAKTSVLLTGLPDLATPPGQKFTSQLRIGRLDPVPIDVSFQLVPGLPGTAPRLVVEKLQARLTDGNISTDRFTLKPPDTDTDFTLRLEGAELARAFAVIGIAGIGGSGRIGGEIPLSIRGDRVAISGGQLANEGPGKVFFDIAALPQTLIERDDTVALVLRALSKFAYDELKLEIDKALDGPGSVRVRLTGANPDVLDNHPFVFNISLESNFDRLAALVLEGLTTSQGLLRALAVSGQASGSPVTTP